MNIKYSLLFLALSATCSIYSQAPGIFENRLSTDDLVLEKSDLPLLYKNLLQERIPRQDGFTLKDYTAFLKNNGKGEQHMEPSHGMPIHTPQGRFHLKVLTPDKTTQHYLLINPVKKR